MNRIGCFLLATLLTCSASAVRAELGNYQVSWAGNSFAGGENGWVTHDIASIFVLPDGRVLTYVRWDESRGNLVLYRDGRIVNQSAHWLNFPRNAGNFAVANAEHAYFVVNSGDFDSVLAQRRLDERGFATNVNVLKIADGKANITGLWCDGKSVWLSRDDGKVANYTANLELVSEFDIAAPGPLVVDASGHTWVLNEMTGVVAQYARGAPTGVTLPLPDKCVVSGLSYRSGIITVSDIANRQVHEFNATQNKLLRSIGGQAGIFNPNGERPVGDLRRPDFISPVGAGRDDQGNLYVADSRFPGSQSNGTTRLTAISPQGKPLWQVYCTEWIDTLDFDARSDGTIAYGSKHKYAVDLSKPANEQFVPVAMTVNPDLYPDDRRAINKRYTGTWHRWIGDHELLYIGEMNGSVLTVYRFDNLIAVPCAEISYAERDGIVWVDRNGDGRRDAAEQTKVAKTEYRGWHIDDRGDIWQCATHEEPAIYHWPLAGMTAHGGPIYGERIGVQQPAPMTSARRIHYDSDNDTMYIAGGATAHWKSAGNLLSRYDNWSKGNRKATWVHQFPVGGASGHQADEPFDFDVAGQFAFMVFASKHPLFYHEDFRAVVEVLRISDGETVGYLHPTGGRTGTVPTDGLQDCVRSCSANLVNGQYVVCVEDDAFAKVVVYTWDGSVKL